MSSAQGQSLIHEYTMVFTSLHVGKRALIEFGADRVLLNRFIVDAASTTGSADDADVLASISLEKVPGDGSEQERLLFCQSELTQLVEMQEEINTLQKVAREKGISPGVLTIIGQAANQSPDDHGASVIKHLNHLLNDNDETGAVALAPQAASTEPVLVQTPESAANDAASEDFERLSSLQQLGATMREHWKPLLVDATVCILASFFAINLVT